MMNGCNKLSDNSKQAKRNNDFRKLNNKKLDQRRLIPSNSIDESYNGSCTNSFRSSRQTTSSGYYSMLPSARERIENQHIFQNHYKYLCELNNSVPKVRVKQDQLLEFYGDRIRCEDWSPIINAIENDQSLRAIKIHNYYFCHSGSANDPALHRQKIMKSLITALQKCLLNSKRLCILHLEAVPFSLSYFKILLKGIENNENLQHVAFPHCSLGNKGCELLCRMLRYKTNVKSVDLSGCGITTDGAQCISQLIQVQKLIRYGDCWKQSLRYRQPNPRIANGLYILILDNNTNLCDSGFEVIVSSLLDDLWISEIYCKNCGLTNESAEQAINLAKNNNFVKCIDLRKNLRIDSDLIKNLERILMKNHCGSALSIQQNWNSETDVSLFPIQKKSNSSIISNIPRSYSSGNPSSIKETNSSFRLSESNNTDVHVPPLKISSLQRNHNRKKVFATKQNQLSELHKVKKELKEAKNKMYDEIGKRNAAEKYCEQLEIQLKRQDNCVLIEKPLLEKLIQTFQEFSCSFNDVVKLDEFTINIEDKTSTINEDVILNLESSILNLSIDNNKNKALDDNMENLSNLKATLQDDMKISLEKVNSLVLDPKRKAQDIYNQILKNYLRNNSPDQEI